VVLKEQLGKMAQVDQVAVYRNVDAESLPEGVVARIESGTIDWVMLTSSAIAARLHALLPEPARARMGRETKLVSLSPVTSETIRKLGWPVAVEASTYTWEGLVQALARHVAAGRT
jgi:uroporphyrinogen III methyltransferase/synthase